jgi:protein-tyrosine phosphatase
MSTRTNCPRQPAELSVSLLEGTPNFRDVGGLPTVDGRVTRRGVLFRSSALEELSARDVRHLLDEIGLRTVIDLRSADDRETAEPLRDTPIRYINLPVTRGAPTTSLERPLDAEGRADMARIYGMYLETSAPSFAEIVSVLTSGATPAVFHCAAGKDRTGVVAAVVLSAVGVTRDAVIADYMETELVLDDIMTYLQRRPAYADIVLRFPPGTMDVERNFIIGFLDDVERTYGGVTAWLTEHAGVSTESIARLEQLLVEPRE